MKLTVDRHALAGALAQATKYVPTRSTIPALGTALLRAGGGELKIIATDLDRLFAATVEAGVEDAGAVAANASLLAGFVKGAAGDDVELALEGSLLEVRSGRARGRIPTIPAGDFPEPFASLAAAASFEIDGAVLADCLDAVRYAISEEESRYYLTGASWLARDGRLELCATDGYVMSLISIEAPAGAEGLKPIIVPDFELPKFSGAVRIDIADTFVRLTGDTGSRVALTSKLIDGTFPDYHRIIRPAVATATVQRKAFVEAVGRMMPLVKTTRGPIHLAHDTMGELVVRTVALDGSEVEDRIDIEGGQFVVSLGGNMLAATLESFDGDTIEIGLTGIGEAVRISDPGKDHRLAIVMPMRGSIAHRIGPAAAEEPSEIVRTLEVHA